MGEYLLEQRVKILCGPGKAGEIGSLVSGMGRKKAILITDRGIVAAGIHERVVSSLNASGIQCVIFDGVVPDPTAENVDDGIRMCREQGCDVVIGVGGGSPMDAAKAVNLLRFNHGSILDYASPDAVMEPAPGLILIPTTSGTGSELSDGIVISSGGAKLAVLAPDAAAEFAVIDPELMTGIPPRLTEATGLDAMSHAIEGYTSTAADMAADLINESLIRSIFKWLPVCVFDGANVSARQEMAVCAAMAGWMLGYSHTNAGHSVAHILGARYHIPHGEACAMATPWVLEFNAVAAPERVKKIGEILGASFAEQDTPEEIGRKAARAYVDFRDTVMGKLDFSVYAPDRADFPDAAKEIVGELFQVFNPRSMEEADAVKILEHIFS